MDESTNKNLMKIINRIIGDKPHECQLHLNHDLWVGIATTKIIIGETLFMLVYGQESMMSVDLDISTYFST